MSSGKRFSAMVLCVSPIKKLYLDPIEYYEPDVVYVFMDNGKSKLSEFGKKIYEASKKDIKCEKIVERHLDTSDFEDNLSEIIEIKRDLDRRYGDGLEFYLNITSGTPEYSAAAMFASMSQRPAVAFSVKADSELSFEKISEIVEVVNGSLNTNEPGRVSYLGNHNPDDEMIAFLKVMAKLLKNTKYVTYHEMIDALKDEGVWSYNPKKKSGTGKTSIEQREEMYLCRTYLNVALENGWLMRPSKNTMRITESGMAYISAYATDGLRYKMITCGRMTCEDHMDMDKVFRKTELYSDNTNPEEFNERSIEEYLSPMKTKGSGEKNTITIGKKGKRYTFNIEMDME